MVGAIKLFPAASTIFTTNGLGSLSDCLSCSVEEERNGIFELTMTYPVTGRRYADLASRQIIFCKSTPFSNPQAFRIYSISKPINGQIEINARHISYDMSGYPVSPFESHSLAQSFIMLKSESPVANIPFTFWTDKTNEQGMSTEKPYAMRTLLGGVKGSVLDTYGGEWEFDNFVAKLHQHRGSNDNVTIRYGKNLTDFKQEENCAETYTAVYPYWFTDEVDTEGGQDPADIPPKLVQLTDKLVEVTSIEEYEDYIYDHVKVLVLDTSEHFKERPTEEQLLAYTQQYIRDNDIGTPKVSIDLSFITLEKAKEYETIQIAEQIELCDTVNVYFPKMNIYATAKCIKTKYDVLKDRYESISLGTPKVEVSDTIAETIATVKERFDDTRSSYEKAVVHATDMITGHTGGFVILNPSNNPKEILITNKLNYMDADAKVWRWNMGGLGFSENGYNGPYRNVALTMDGMINAEYITVGILDGAIIKAGSVTAAAIAQEYTKQIFDEIGNSSGYVTQLFMAADGILRSQITELTTETRNNYNATIAKYSDLKQDVDGLNFTVAEQVSGGSNKIRNSVGLNGSTGWTNNGEVYPISQDDVNLDDTVSGSEWYLNAGNMSQLVGVNKNKNYILSFKYRLDTAMKSEVILLNGDETERVLLTAVKDYASNQTYNTDDIVKHSETVDDISVEHVYKCLDDGVTGDWDETKWELYPVTAWYDGTTEQWIEVVHKFTAKTKAVEFIASTQGAGFYLSDIYILEGTIKGSWQPAEDEIYGENVKIDKFGIHVLNPEAETQTIMDHEHFAVCDNNGQEILSVHPTYSWLLRLRVKRELDVGKLRIMPTDIGAELMIMGQEVE